MTPERPHILLVEDDPDDYVLTLDLLRTVYGKDFDIDWVDSWEAGLKRVLAGAHDICLVDYRLGGKTGLDLIHRAVGGGYRMPIILLTGQDDLEIDLKAMEVGATDYLFKGEITEPLLERSIRYALKQKKVEAALRESEQRFCDFAETASDGHWEMDAGLRYTNVWGAVLEGLRQKEGAPIGKTRWEHIGVDPNENEEWRKHKEDMEARRPFRDFEYSYVNTRGRQHRRASGRPIFDATGSFIGYRGIVENISERVHAESRAQSVQRRLEYAIQSMPEGIALFDAEDRLVVRNNVERDYGEIAHIVKTGARFEDLCRAAVAGGILPEACGNEEEFVQERLARHRDPSGPFEQRLGERRLEIREHKLPDGSTIVVQTDVTEKRAAAEALQQEQKFVSKVFETSNALVMVLDPSGRIVRFNRACEVVSGYSAKEVEGQLFWDILTEPDDIEKINEAYADPSALSIPREIEHHWTTKNGERRLISWANSRVYGEHGKVEYVTAIGIDLTKRIRAEEDAKRSQELLRQFMDSATDSMSILDHELNYIDCNDLLVYALGRPKEEIIGRNLGELAPDSKASGRYQKYLDVIRTGQPFMHEFETLQPSTGSIVYLSASVFKVGSGLGVVSQNVTERKHAEEALRKSNSMFEQAFDSNPNMISLVRTHDLRFIRVNQAWIDRYGISREEAIGKTAQELNIWANEDDRNAVYQELEDKGRLESRELNFIARDGQTFDVELVSEITDFEGGSVIFSVGQDLTKRRGTERVLRAAKKAAELANRTKSEFLANMSHELRTPLNAISGFSQALQSGIGGPLTERQKEYLGDIQTSGDHLLALINDVPDLSKVELGELELSDEAVDLADCIETSVRMFNERKHVARLEVETSGLVGLPPIRGDSRKIRQTLLNLLSNAFKFTNHGDEIGVSAGVADGGAVYFQVKDTGIGMSPDGVDVALSLFGQVDSGLARNYEGSGLGLPLCKSLIEAHDGILEIESEPGIGTKVRAIFPPERVLADTTATTERLQQS